MDKFTKLRDEISTIILGTDIVSEKFFSSRTKYEELAGKVSAALPASVTGKKEE